MAITKFQVPFSRRKSAGEAEEPTRAADIERPADEKTAMPNEKEADTTSEDMIPTGPTQDGVLKMQAVTQVWTKWSLAGVLCLYVVGPLCSFESNR
jgi:hypothetical protein